MELYCAPCRKNHYIPPAQAERMVYAFQGALADAESAEPLYDWAEEVPRACFEEMARSASDIEGYAEYADSLVTERRAQPSARSGRRYA